MEKSIELPCELGSTVYWVMNDCIWKCEFLGIKYYSSKKISDVEPIAYIYFSDLREQHPIDCIHGNVKNISFLSFDPDWCGYDSSVRQPLLSAFGKTIFTKIEDAKAKLYKEEDTHLTDLLNSLNRYCFSSHTEENKDCEGCLFEKDNACQLSALANRIGNKLTNH
jgi:hypothetical protein